MQKMIRKHPRKPSFKETHGMNSLSYFEPEGYDYLKYCEVYDGDSEE